MQYFTAKEDISSYIPGLFPGNTEFSNKIYYQLSPEELIKQSIENGEGVLSDSGALVIDTGEFTGRCPKDRFIVKNAVTADTINWNEFNQPVEEAIFKKLYSKMLQYFAGKILWVRDCYACALPEQQVAIRVINENACCNLFAYNMFLRPAKKKPAEIKIDWHLIQAPHFFADPSADGVPRKNFVIINFSEKIILIGGTQYTGEIKKAVFSVLNYLLPFEKNIVSMHCAANSGASGDTALFFGLSGTGKTTLSADNNRQLIGDDEHGWDDNSVFNLEGGCYAKTINLDPSKEPQIYNAIKLGAIVENVTFIEGSRTIDFSGSNITENTRASYPIDFIKNAVTPSAGRVPANIFFLTADAFGVLPPVSRLSREQAMYHFLSGYTAKIAGTENGIVEPKPTFSACFGAPFIPLHPTVYADLLGKKIKEHHVKVWMINTGWVGGSYKEGARIPLDYTRAIITAALTGSLDNIEYKVHKIFGTMVPQSCPNVPAGILNPEQAWNDKEAYNLMANRLASYFIKNFEKYAAGEGNEIVIASPVICRC
jgi:phosphoenolpyruvate carboxykinase (ATP)